jgi:hypothetical protein
MSHTVAGHRHQRYVLIFSGVGNYDESTFVAKAHQNACDCSIAVPEANQDGALPDHTILSEAFSSLWCSRIDKILTSILLKSVTCDSRVVQLFSHSPAEIITFQNVRLIGSSTQFISWSQVWRDTANSLSSWPCLTQLHADECGYIVEEISASETHLQIDIPSLNILEEDKRELHNLQTALAIRA